MVNPIPEWTETILAVLIIPIPDKTKRRAPILFYFGARNKKQTTTSQSVSCWISERLLAVLSKRGPVHNESHSNRRKHFFI